MDFGSQTRRSSVSSNFVEIDHDEDVMKKTDLNDSDSSYFRIVAQLK
jgi:hypothetical protein